MTNIVKAKARWNRTPAVARANAATTMARVNGLDEQLMSLAHNVVSHAQAVLNSEVGATPSEQDMIDRYSESLEVIQVEGRRFGRRNAYPRNSRIPVALVVPQDAAVSAQLVEYGAGGLPGLYPLTKAVYELGGDTL